jgi:hypothetical protein
MAAFFLPLRPCRTGVIAALFATLALGGCATMSEVGFDAQNAVTTVGPADRCIDFMRRAFLDSDINVTSRDVAVVGNSFTVRISGAREKVPADGNYAREVGVECRFDGNILTGFRWTAGPLLAGAPQPNR